MEKEIKRKRNYSWIFPLAFYTAVVLGICLIAYEVHVNNKEVDCLKPYAQQYCQSKNHSYIDHNLVYMTCSNEAYDPRMVGSSNIVQYYFNDTERKICGADK